MPSIFPLYFHEQDIGHVFSDDTVALVRLRISSRTNIPHNKLFLYYLVEENDKKYILKENLETENSTLISSLSPIPLKFVCELKRNESKTSKGNERKIHFEEKLDDLKNQIRETFRNKKYDFHQIISIPSVIFRVKNASKGTLEIFEMCQISANVPCIIEWGTKLDPPKIYLYRDIISLEPNENVITSWWRKRMKHSKNWKYVVQLRSDSGVYGNNRYSTLLINRNMDIYYEWSYTTPLEMKDVINGLGKKVQNSAGETFGSNDLEMRECTIRYEVFLSVGDLYHLFECCAETLDTFFETPNQEKPFNLRYRPKYCNKTPTKCNINVRFQKMSLNNSIVIVIHTTMATWTALQDCLEVLYFLFDHERLRDLNPSQASYKDLDPYLFKTNVKKGGYTRQCLNYNDPKLGTKKRPVKRYKVPRVLFTKEDHEMYDALPEEHKRYVLYYRGLYYAAIDDFRENKDVVENYNKKSKRKETFLNTVVLFEIKEKYRDGTQEQLYYPGCVRAKSGMPPLKHRYVLNKLLRSGEIDLVGKGGEEMKRKLETNADLKRGDVIHYISKYPGRLTSDSYAYLPTLVKKMLIPFFDGLDKQELIRKGSIDGQFVHALAEACVPRYRTEWPNEKIKIVKDYMERSKQLMTKQIFHWIHFGFVCRQMSYETYCNQFKNFQNREHTYLYDIMSVMFNVNIFVIHLNSEGKLEKITRTTEFNIKRKSVILLKFENSYEVILKMQRTKRKSTTDSSFLWDSGDRETKGGMIRSLNNIFMRTNKIAGIQGNSIATYKLWSNHVLAQVVDIFNKSVGIIDRWGFFMPFLKGCSPIPGLPMYSCIPKNSIGNIVNRLKQDPTGAFKGQHLYIFNPDNQSIIGIQCCNGEIIPCNEVPISDVIVNDKSQLISQYEIPYMINVTHYRLRIEKSKDARIQMIADESFVKKVTGGILEELQRLLCEEKIIPESAWKKINSIQNVRERQKRLFPLLMSIFSNRIFQSDSEKGTSFQRKPNVVIREDILEKAVFQSFHYITRNPKFGQKKKSSSDDKKHLKITSNDEECIFFSSIEDAEDFIRMIHISDNDLLDATEQSRDQLPESSLCLFSFPIHHENLMNVKIDYAPLSKDYVSEKKNHFYRKLSHLRKTKTTSTGSSASSGQKSAKSAKSARLSDSCLEILIWSLVLQKTIVVMGINGHRDIYNPFAGNELIIKSK